jgi:hypothetical protein
MRLACADLRRLTTGTQAALEASYSISFPSSSSKRQVPASREKYIRSSAPGGAAVGAPCPLAVGTGISGLGMEDDAAAMSFLDTQGVGYR